MSFFIGSLGHSPFLRPEKSDWTQIADMRLRDFSEGVANHGHKRTSQHCVSDKSARHGFAHRNAGPFLFATFVWMHLQQKSLVCFRISASAASRLIFTAI